MVDWTLVLVAACAAVPPTITALATLRQGQLNAKIGTKTAQRVEEVHDATNGMKAELVQATRLLAFAQGKAEGRAEGKDTP